jgi:hypothetical protein
LAERFCLPMTPCTEQNTQTDRHIIAAEPRGTEVVNSLEQKLCDYKKYRNPSGTSNTNSTSSASAASSTSTTNTISIASSISNTNATHTETVIGSRRAF